MKINKGSLWIFTIIILFFIFACGASFVGEYLDKPIESKNMDTEDTTEEAEPEGEKFKPVGLVKNTKWVKFSNALGQELYTYITPFGGICKIYVGVSSIPSLFPRECHKYITGLPEKASIEAIRTIYAADCN